LKAEGVNNVNNLHRLIINTLILTTALSRRVGTNVDINSSLDDPLQAPIQYHDVSNKSNKPTQ
jgi:hypothetical protein